MAARLNALLDRTSSTPVPSPELGSLPAEVPGHVTLMEWATEARPVLEGLRREVERAATQRELAEKQIWPDFTVGVQYGLGRMQGDYKGMGGASVGFSVPIYAGKRQRKLRDEAAAMEGMVRARLTHTLAAVDAGLGELLARVDESRALLQLYREDVLPQARATVESSLSAYQAGTVDFMTLVDAQMALNRFQGEYYELLASYGTVLAQLEMTIGRELPETAELITENR
jgi:outer membrane protein TolC